MIVILGLDNVEAKWKTKCVLVQVVMMGMLDLDNTSSAMCFALEG